MTNPTPPGQVPEALPVALLIAQDLERITPPSEWNETFLEYCAAAELRRLHAENEALRAQQPAPATQKLTEQICISDTNQSAACVVGNVGTTSDAQTTHSTHDAPATQQVGEVPSGYVIDLIGKLFLWVCRPCSCTEFKAWSRSQ